MVNNDQRNTFMCIYRSYDKYSPELREMVNTVKYAAFSVGLMGFLLGMVSTGSQFEANHYHTKWRTRFTAVVRIGATGCQGCHGTGKTGNLEESIFPDYIIIHNV